MNSNKFVSANVTRRIRKIENHPGTPALLKRLPPRATAKLFSAIGITDASVLMERLPTRTLLHTMDESIWTSAQPGSRETVDVRVLMEWLIALNDVGESFLVHQLEAMSEDYLVLVLSQLMSVDCETRYATYGEVFDAFVEENDGGSERFGPYLVQLLREENRDMVRDTVHALWHADSDRFLRILGRLSHTLSPEESIRGWTPTLHDVEFERQSFREAQGFVTAEGARAFLSFAESQPRVEISALSSYDPETRRHLDAIARGIDSPSDTANPIAAELDDEEVEEDEAGQELLTSNQVADDADANELHALLEEAQVLETQSPLRLLTDARTLKEPALTIELRRMAAENIESYYARARELAYVANVLNAALSIEGRPLEDAEAKAAAFAICNLGIEVWDETHTLEIDSEPGLIRAFLSGWQVLRELPNRVVAEFARSLSAETPLAPWLRGEATVGLSELRRAVERRRFEDARDAVVFLSIAFNSKACHAIVPLLDAIPRFSLLLENCEPSKQARWIATKSDVEAIHRGLHSLAVKSVDPAISRP